MAARGIDETMQALLACVCERLADAGRPACSCATTIGQPMVVSPCLCDDGTEGEGEAWMNLMRLYRGDRTSGADATPAKPCAPVTWMIQMQLTLARCFPTIDETGNLPDAEAQSVAAAQLHADAATIARAVNCCPLDEPAYLETVNVQTDPTGGASFLVATIRVPVSVAAALNT